MFHLQPAELLSELFGMKNSRLVTGSNHPSIPPIGLIVFFLPKESLVVAESLSLPCRLPFLRRHRCYHSPFECEYWCPDGFPEEASFPDAVAILLEIRLREDVHVMLVSIAPWHHFSTNDTYSFRIHEGDWEARNRPDRLWAGTSPCGEFWNKGFWKMRGYESSRFYGPRIDLL